jgi:hypothetical protein
MKKINKKLFDLLPKRNRKYNKIFVSLGELKKDDCVIITQDDIAGVYKDMNSFRCSIYNGNNNSRGYFFRKGIKFTMKFLENTTYLKRII